MAFDPADIVKLEALAGNMPSQRSALVRGQGGGLADFVPATVDGVEPARISEGEFIVPADVVSMLGDGSTEAGARILQNMIEKVRVAKQGNKEQADPIPGGPADQ